MNIEASNLVSNGKPVKGFEQDGNFVGCEPMGNYLIYTFSATNPSTNKFNILNKDDFHLELVSLLGTNNEFIQEMICYENQVGNNQNQLWSTNFQAEPTGRAYLPYSFKSGILIPPNSKLYFNLSSAVNFFQVVCKPIIPTLAGSINQEN